MNRTVRIGAAITGALLVGCLAAFFAMFVVGFAAKLFVGGPGILWPDWADTLTLCAGIVAFAGVAFVVFKEISA